MSYSKVHSIRLFVIIIFILCGSSATMNAQYRTTLDSLRQLLPTLKDADQRMSSIKNVYRTINVGSNKEEELELASIYIEQAHADGKIKEGAEARTIQLNCYFNNGNYDTYLSIFSETMDYLRKNKCWNYYFSVWSGAVQAYYFSDRVKIGLEQTHKMYEEAKKLDNHLGMGTACYCMGKGNSILNRFEEALSYFKDGIGYLKGYKENSPHLLFQCYTSATEVLNETKKYAEAIPMIVEMEKIINDIMKEQHAAGQSTASMTSALFPIYERYIKAYLGMGKIDMAEKKYTLYAEQVKGCNELYYIQLLRNHFRILLAKGDYKAAYTEADSMISYFRKTQDIVQTITSLQYRAQAANKCGRSEQAVADLEEVLTLSDSLRTNESNEQMSKLRTTYELDKITAEKQQNHIYFIFVSIICILLMIILAFFITHSRRLTAKNRILFHNIQELMQLKNERLHALVVEAQKETEYCTPQTPEKLLMGRLITLFETEHIFTDENLNRQSLAKQLDTNATLLSEVIHQESHGMKVSEYINSYRLMYACELLLKRKDLTVEAISSECGFSARSTFFRLFKQHTGMSPIAFREMGNSQNIHRSDQLR